MQHWMPNLIFVFLTWWPFHHSTWWAHSRRKYPNRSCPKHGVTCIAIICALLALRGLRNSVHFFSWCPLWLLVACFLLGVHQCKFMVHKILFVERTCSAFATNCLFFCPCVLRRMWLFWFLFSTQHTWRIHMHSGLITIMLFFFFKVVFFSPRTATSRHGISQDQYLLSEICAAYPFLPSIFGCCSGFTTANFSYNCASSTSFSRLF